MDEQIALPVYIEDIIGRLEEHGYNGYIVGGCVRDSLMGISPHDYDITTDAKPDETAACLCGYRIIETGLKHGTLTVVTGGGDVEITTHRVDGGYSDNRHPDKVTFTHMLALDLSRRDFTINAMAYNRRTGIVDLYSGRRHIIEKIIACVGDSDLRFREDGLRILRALRFASVLGFAIEAHTGAAIRRSRELLRNISAERIFCELVKLLCGKDAGYILAAWSDVIREIIPEISAAGLHALSDVFNNATPDRYVRLALLFCGEDNKVAAETAQYVLRRLKADNNTIRTVCELVDNYNADIIAGERQIKRLLRLMPPEQARRLFAVRRANLVNDSIKIKELDAAEALIKKITAENECVSLKTLAVNGSDLIGLGIKQGPDIGKTLERLLEMVIDGEADNSREALIGAALRLM